MAYVFAGASAFINHYFAGGVDVLWPGIQQVLRNPTYSNYTVFFTGHSLGGALAAVAAARTVAEVKQEKYFQIAMQNLVKQCKIEGETTKQ
ncbi:hypothetical protein ANCDUO_09268 [Ancylostoma duodenale]|uniref:Fungal lipase-type domain-containing protein n=1 Tax=Ancylostoma duodenale TaxID=51022 RepID=A0A0C2CU99_9BILA|nr:hypothetical protein ANCDUO_09268 [Ancylostoma duodenale]